MSKLILGPRIFVDSAYGAEHVPGLVHWYNSTVSNYYGYPPNATLYSNIEKPPAGIDGTTVTATCPTLISYQTNATAPGAVGTAPQYSDYYRKLLLAGGPPGTTELRIYTGTKPDSPDVMTSLDTYSSNLLVSMPVNGYSADESISGFRYLTHKPTSVAPGYDDIRPAFNGMSFLLGICPTFTNSTNTAAAVATWFWYGNVYGGTSDLTDVPFVIGTVGSTADSDLVIPDTVIKPDTAYKSYGFKFEIPVMYTI